MKKAFLGIISAFCLTVSFVATLMVAPIMVGPACALAFNSPTLLPENADLLFDRNGQILNPTVRVHAHGSTGSATALEVTSPGGSTKVIFVTNHHVIAGNIPKPCEVTKKEKCDGPPLKMEPVVLRGWITLSGKMYPVIYKAKIVAFDKVDDLAILETDEPWVGPTAKILPEAVTLVPGEDVWVAGSALGERGHITTGLLGLVDQEIQNLSFMMVSAPIMPGNSGGGLYVQRGHTYYLAGVPDSIALSDGQMMTSHGYVIPIRRVIEGLEAMKLTIVDRQ